MSREEVERKGGPGYGLLREVGENNDGTIPVPVFDPNSGTGPIAAASQYYLTEDHTTTWKKELLTQIFLLAVCISGAYLYFDPAKAYASRVGRPDLAWYYITSTCFPALATLYVATDIFFKMQMSSLVPNRLKGFLVNAQSRLARVSESTFIGTISLLSSVVLTAVFLRFSPANWSIAAVAVMAAIILFDNTMLHFLPVKLMLTQKIWRLPFLPFEYLGKWLFSKYKECNLSLDQKQLNAFAAVKAQDHMQLRMALRTRLQQAKQKLMRESLPWVRRDIQLGVQLPSALKNLTTSDTPLLDILAYYEAPGLYFTINPTVNTVLQLATSVVGALWIWSCATGYYAAPLNQFEAWTGSYAAAGGITALPIYSLSVLLGFFGVFFVGQVYGYLTTWGDNVTKIPMEVKFAPKTFILCMALNAAMIGGSYAAAAELVHSQITYEWAQPLIPFLLGCTYSGISYAGFMATRDFIFSMMGKIMQHLPTGDWSEVMKAGEKIDQMSNACLYMDGDRLEAELSAMPTDQREQLLGMNDMAYQGMINHQMRYDTQAQAATEKARNPSCLARIFCCAKTPDQTSLLGNSDRVMNSSLA